ncbi:MAG: transcriptional regulator [Deltaproteobacteria bacterium]|nr:transcriptional regulator [Deltaproteobacteria bacterium]
MRGTQLVRQWRILRLLESRKRGLTASEIASELDAPARTVYRDLESIQQAGFPVFTERGDGNSYWKLMEGFKAGIPLPLTTTELMSLHMSREILKVFDGTVFQESVESLFNKVRASLPKETVRYLERISGSIRVGFGHPKNLQEFKEVISQISDATAKRRQVEILYRAVSTGKETTRRVDPYQVWAMNGTFYLIGLCHLRNSIRTFAMDRISKLTVLDDTYHRPRDFSLEEYLQSAFRVMRGAPERVQVWFSSGSAHVVRERVWHPTQEIREQDDGSLVITLEVPINYEVVSWILGFGSSAEVLHPDSLKKRILEELEASVQRYRHEGPARTKIVREKKIQSKLS